MSYAGSEIKGHPDYQADWNIGDNELVELFRPKDVVTDPLTIGSFEGRSVLDGHPPSDVAIVDVQIGRASCRERV